MPQLIFRSARLTLLFPLIALPTGLFWCAIFTRSPIVAVASFALIAAIFVLSRDQIATVWRQKLVLEDDCLIYFDGKNSHQILFAEIELIRVGRWVGNLRVRQNAGHSLSLLPRSGEIKYWDVSDFSLNVVLRLSCELARRADGPPIEICQTEFQNLRAELHDAVRKLGTLTPKSPECVDETTLSLWEKEIRSREQSYSFTPHR